LPYLLNQPSYIPLVCWFASLLLLPILEPK
jgi:hypothetical protein